MCGTTHKTVKRIVDAHEAWSTGAELVPRVDRTRNYDEAADLVAKKVNVARGGDRRGLRPSHGVGDGHQ